MAKFTQGKNYQDIHCLSFCQRSKAPHTFFAIAVCVTDSGIFNNHQLTGSSFCSMGSCIVLVSGDTLPVWGHLIKNEFQLPHLYDKNNKLFVLSVL